MAASFSCSGYLAKIAYGKIGYIARFQMMLSCQRSCDLLNRRRNLGRSTRLDIDLIYNSCKARRDSEWVHRRRIGPVCIGRLRGSRHSKNSLLGSSEWNQDDVILILSVGRLAFRSKQPNDFHGHALN